MKIVCFDLNKTLIECNSWLDLNLAMGMTQQEDDQIMDWSKREIISDQQGQQILKKIYQESGRHTRKNITEILSKYTYTVGAKELVVDLKQKGYKIVLISGAMDILVKKVAEELEIEDWYCNNQFIFDENEMLYDIVTVSNDYIAKLQQLTTYCNKLNVQLTDVYCIGDGANDRMLFTATGKGITFHGSKIESDAWKVVGSLKEIIDIL